MKARRLGSGMGDGIEVSALGLGCMGMSFGYGGQEEQTSLATIERAFELGVTFFDTAEVYGPFDNERLLGKAIRRVRDQVVIATKFGFKISDEGVGTARMVGVDSRPEHVKAVAEGSLRRLGIDVIDLFYQHRVDPSVPIEDTVGAMSDLVREGKVRAIGLSEASAAAIRRAHRVHAVSAVQSEYSLFNRGVEADVLPACRELNIAFVPYSPLGRGLLSGSFQQANLAPDDFRHTLPQFQGDNLVHNLLLVDRVKQLAAVKGVTAAQLALAWLLHQGDNIIPIPGARKIHHLEDNVAAADVVLSDAELNEIERTSLAEDARGARYGAREMALVNQ